MVEFEANALVKEIALNWTTATERNNSGFRIERRTEDEPDYREIGWTNGAGNSDTPLDYAYTDSDVQPGVTYYYRLQQEDFDGTTEYSPVRKARLRTMDNDLTVQPNPTNGNVQLSWLRDAGTYRADVYSVGGKLVLSRENISERSYGIDLSDLPAQMYLLRVTTTEGVVTKRVLLRK